MEMKKQSRFKVGMYRFWIEYKQFFEGASTLRMRRRAEERRLRAGRPARVGILGFGALDLMGI